GGEGRVLYLQGYYAEALPFYDSVIQQLFPDAATETQCIAQGRSPSMSHQLKSRSSLRYPVAGFLNLMFRERGDTNLHLGRYETAASDFRIALAFRSWDDEVREKLTYTYTTMGEMEDAENLALFLLSRGQTGVRLRLLGFIYYRENRQEDAY